MNSLHDLIAFYAPETNENQRKLLVREIVSFMTLHPELLQKKEE
jgi:hypothetical protein